MTSGYPHLKKPKKIMIKMGVSIVMGDVNNGQYMVNIWLMMIDGLLTGFP